MSATQESDRLRSRHTVFDDAWLGKEGVRFSGRLTHARHAPTEEASRWRALRRTARLLLTIGRRGEVTWQAAHLRWSAVAGPGGYWEHHAPALTDLSPGWHDIVAEPETSSPAGLLVPDPGNRFGIISDIDDTILITQVLRKRALVLNSLTLAPEQRQCVPGMAEAYGQLLQQNPRPAASPVFYISCSPCQLTDNLRRFLHAQNFPRGILLLRNIDRRRGRADHDHVRYKIERIAAALRSLPAVRFALFGDDAEDDPEIYAHIRRDHADQIAGIYIRRVHPDPQRARYPDQFDLAELPKTPCA